MKKIMLTVLAFILHSTAIAQSTDTKANQMSPLNAVKTIIAAVNEKDADKYASVFDKDVIVKLHQGAIRITGRDALKQNRAQHFLRHPTIHAEIQHLVEISPKVIMHDKVWLQGKSGEAADIVEIYTFKNGLIVEVDIIQPAALVAKPK